MSVHELPVLPGVEHDAFRNAMACLGAAVNIITTDGPAGRAGFTASAVCSVTDTPPTLLVCLNRSASVWPMISSQGRTAAGSPHLERLAPAAGRAEAGWCYREILGAGQPEYRRHAEGVALSFCRR